MKCWISNKKNPANKKTSINFDCTEEYGSMFDVVAMIRAITAIHKKRKDKTAKERNENE